MDDDPYTLDQAALEGKLRQLQEHFDRWRQILQDEENSDQDGGLEDEFDWLTHELQQLTKSIRWDIDDLSDTAATMHSRIPNQSLLNSRQQFVANSRTLISTIDNQVRARSGRSADANVEPTSTGAQVDVTPAPTQLDNRSGDEVDGRDDDDELLIPDPILPARTSFRIASGPSLNGWAEVWRKHKAVVTFVCCIVALLLLILVMSLATQSPRLRGNSTG